MQHVSTRTIAFTYHSESAKALGLLSKLPDDAATRLEELIFRGVGIILGKTVRNLKLIVPRQRMPAGGNWLEDACPILQSVSFPHAGIVVVPAGLHDDVVMILKDASGIIAEVHDVTVHIGALAPLPQVKPLPVRNRSDQPNPVYEE